MYVFDDALPEFLVDSYVIQVVLAVLFVQFHLKWLAGGVAAC